MNPDSAIKSLSALAHEARLAVFRLLVKAGPEGLSAGTISVMLGVAPNTLSAQLLALANAGLVKARRDGRWIIYAIDFDAMGALLLFLTEDCCGGHKEVCAPLTAVVQRCCA